MSSNQVVINLMISKLPDEVPSSFCSFWIETYWI